MGSRRFVYKDDKMRLRERVKGSGPDRTELKIFHKLGTVSKETVAELNHILDTCDRNDIGSDNYSITNTIDYEDTHGVKKEYYRQLILQENKDGPTLKNAEVGQVFKESEDQYSIWANKEFDIDTTISDINRYFRQVFRFRLSETLPHHSVAWHIDTNTSVMCRAQICLHENDSLFEFKNREGIHQLFMKPGELWFINTGWNHRVVANNDLRRTAVFSFRFEDLIESQDLYV